MSKEIVSVIKQLEATRSRNAKEQILMDNKDLPGLREFFFAALDPFNTYFVKKLPKYEQGVDVSLTLGSAINMLDSLKNRTVTGNAALDYIANMLSKMPSDEADLLCRVIQKDPNCGVGGDTVNKIWKCLVSKYPVLLCSAHSDKLVNALNWEDGVFVQLKSDGARVNIIIDENGVVECFSRKGSRIDTKGRFDYLGAKYKNVVIDGELLYRDGDVTVSRAIGNGIVNKAIRGTISKEEASHLYVMVWDVISYNDFRVARCKTKYKERFAIVKTFEDGDGIKLAPTKLVHTLEEAYSIYLAYRELGLEGVILKDQDALWEDARSKKQVKLKAEIISTLKVIGYKEGTGQFEGLMGSLICASECDKVVVNIGGGWSIKDRAQLAADYHRRPIQYQMMMDDVMTTFTATPSDCSPIGLYLDVTHNGLVSSNGEYSVYLARVDKWRFDVVSADTLEDIRSKK
jgi:hypothetical protein